MRKELLALAATFILFSMIASSAFADTFISTCQVINTPGTYVLSADITSDVTVNPYYCILINQTDNVVLDLDGHTIRDGSLTPPPYGGTDVGIYVLGAPTYSTGLEVRNGVVDGFDYGMAYGFYDEALIEGMTFYRNNVGLAVASATSVFSSDIGYIQYNNFTQNQIGLTIDGSWNLNVSHNTFQDNVLQDIKTNGVDKSTFAQNVIGRINLTDCCYDDTFYVFGVAFGGLTCISPCQGTFSGSGTGLLCKDCTDDVFIQNVIYASVDASFTGFGPGYADSNRFYYNQFLTPGPSYGVNGLYLSAVVSNAYGCGNRGTVIDLGTNNTFASACPPEIGGLSCDAGYRCRDDYTLDYLETDCHANASWDCGHIIGSVLPTCVANGTSAYCVDTMGRPLPTTTLPYGTPLIPLEPVSAIDAVTWRAAGYGWILPFFSVLFLATMFLIGVSAVAGWIGGPYAGATSAIVLTFVYSLMGIYTPWVAIIMVLLAIASAAYLLSRVAGGGGAGR